MIKADKDFLIEQYEKSLKDIDNQLIKNYGHSSRITLNKIRKEIISKLEGLR